LRLNHIPISIYPQHKHRADDDLLETGYYPAMHDEAKSKSTSLDFQYDTDTDRETATNQHLTAKPFNAAPRIYRLHSTETTTSLALSRGASHPDQVTHSKHTPVPPETPFTPVTPLDAERKSRAPQKEECTLQEETSLTKEETSVSEEEPNDGELKTGGDGEVSATKKTSESMYQLMAQLLRMHEADLVTQTRTSTATTPGQYVNQYPMYYHPPMSCSNSMLPPHHQRQATFSTVLPSVERDGSQLTIPPPPPPPPATSRGPQRGVMSAQELHAYGLQNRGSNGAPIERETLKSMPNANPAWNPMMNMNVSSNAEAAQYYYKNGMYYGYVAALQHLQQLQQQQLQQQPYWTNNLQNASTSRGHNAMPSMTNSKMQYLTPGKSREYSDTFSSTVAGPSELSKYSSIPRSRSTRYRTTNHSNYSAMYRNNNTAVATAPQLHTCGMDVDEEDEDDTKAVELTRTNTAAVLEYRGSQMTDNRSVGIREPATSHSSYLPANKHSSGDSSNGDESSEEHLSSSSSDSDGYDTHTYTTNLSDAQIMIQITSSENKNYSNEMRLNDTPLMQLNVSEKVRTANSHCSSSMIMALPEEDEIEVHQQPNSTQEMEADESKQEATAPNAEDSMLEDNSHHGASEQTVVEHVGQYDEEEEEREQEAVEHAVQFALNYGLELIGREEPTKSVTDIKSNSTVIEDTYLKYLDI